MPIIHVRMLPQKSSINLTDVFKKVSAGAAKVLGVPETKVWVTWEILPNAQSLDAGVPAAFQPEGSHPPVVWAILYEGRTPEMKKAFLEKVADTLSEGLQIRKGNVIMTIHEALSGQFYVGGRVREGT